jgi:AcrR family transcriptional regulator
VSSRAPTRKRLTAEQRRGAILDAALEVFAARGFHGSSIDDIAGAAGISKALIYEHFDSKQDLYLALVGLHTGELFERLAENAGVGPPSAERLERGVETFFRFVEERRDAWRMLFREAADPDVAAVLDRIVAGVTALVAQLIAQDPAVHEADDEQIEEAVEMLAQLTVGAVQSLANWWADHQEVPREQLVEIVMGFAWLGLERLRAGERWSDGRA